MDIKQIPRGRSQPKKKNDPINIKYLSYTCNYDEINKKHTSSANETKNGKK
jgi:hypothetical protein